MLLPSHLYICIRHQILIFRSMTKVHHKSSYNFTVWINKEFRIWTIYYHDVMIINRNIICCFKKRSCKEKMWECPSWFLA